MRKVPVGVATIVLLGLAMYAAEPGRGAPIHTAKAIHQLTVDEARRRRPVELPAVTVLVYLPDTGGIFTADDSGGIFLLTPSGMKLGLTAGDVVRVSGVSGPGDFAPIVEVRDVTVVGRRPLPAARPVSLDHLSTGAEDGQWVEIKGTVRSVVQRAGRIVVQVASGWSRVDVEIPDTDAGHAREARRLIGARVRLPGASAPIFNRRRQVVGVNV